MKRRIARKKQRKILIITSIVLLFIMTAGYAAFNTNINITAKGNIKEKPFTIQELKETVVSSGEGLYKDTYETDKYFYKGKNPNNYITISDELWRIISIEPDNTIKIIKNESIGDMIFDETNSNSWARPATINTYLNTTYYNSLNKKIKEKIVSREFNIGPAEWCNTDLNAQMRSENSIKWKGNVGLITLSEFIRVNTNTAQCNNHKLVYDNRTVCPTTNYINSLVTNSSNNLMWSITPRSGSGVYSFFITDGISTTGNSVKDYAFGIFPVVHLNKDIKLKYIGTKENPYQIVK